jgi:glycosyltransferase involved in cell wall biosynthesis
MLSVIRHPTGGIRTYLKYVYRHLPKSKYSIDVLALRTEESALIVPDVGGTTRIFELPPQTTPLGLLSAVVKRLVTGGYDLLHSHGLGAGAIAALANEPFGVPHVLTPHGVLSDDDFSGSTGRIKRRAMGALLGRADVIQSVGEEAERNLLRYMPRLARRTKLMVISHGIDVENFATVPRAGRVWRSRLTNDGGFLFGFVGRFLPEKGFEYLIDAVRLLANRHDLPTVFRVAVIGDGGFVRERRAQIDSLGLSRYFNFVGFVDDVAPVLAALDALVIPSILEASSLIAMEALIMGCPLIASECIGLRGVTAGAPVLRVPPASGDALAAAMADMLSRYDAIRESALEYRPTARARFDSRRVASELDNVFDKLLVGKNRLRAEPAGRGAQHATERCVGSLEARAEAPTRR